MPKAGSTVLQARLKEARSALRRRRVTYPGRGLNHNFLAAGVMEPGELPRIFRQHYRGREEALATDFDIFWAGLIERRDTLKPRIMVLSGEALWSIRASHGEALGRLLARLTDDIEVVVYVRRPSDFYLSAAQQRLKASSKIGPVGAVAYRQPIEALARVAPTIHVLPYDRRLFPDGDICSDFEQRFLGRMRVLTKARDGVPHQNVTLSAEAMAIVQSYRRANHSERQSEFTRDTGALMRALRGAEELEEVRPELHESVRRQIDQSSPDLLWLRDRWRIEFDGIDYDALHEAPSWTPAAVADICMVDEAARERLLLRAFAEVLRGQAEGEMRFRTVFKQRRKKGRPAGETDHADATSSIGEA